MRTGYIGGNAGMAKQEAMMAPSAYVQPSPLEELRQRREILAAQLANVDAAIEALESHPEVTRVLELLAKV